MTGRTKAEIEAHNEQLRLDKAELQAEKKILREQVVDLQGQVNHYINERMHYERKIARLEGYCDRVRGVRGQTGWTGWTESD